MISVYGLMYYALEYAQESINSIVGTAGEGLEINVIDSHSARSAEIADWGHRAVNDGLITRFISADTNCKGAGPVWAYRNFPPSSDIIVVTDLDVIAKPGWLDELKFGLKTKELAGFGLELDNYIEPNYGFTELHFGTWLMGMKVDLYERYLESQDHHLDSLVLQEAKWDYYKSEMPLKHLGWNTWRDYPAYWTEKLEHVDWRSSLPTIFSVYDGEGK